MSYINDLEVMMSKDFLTYNQQMKKLRNDKGIVCKGGKHKKILIKYGYFNIINGYKNPFVDKIDANNNNSHVYFKNTSMDDFLHLKIFDDDLRLFLFEYISKTEEEIRTMAGYSFDDINDNGNRQWYLLEAYSKQVEPQEILKFISNTFSQVQNSKNKYVQHYIKKHKYVPTWILMKTISFATFIQFLNVAPVEVKDKICKLYHICDAQGRNNYKLLIGSLHWMRQVRNACAHNERIYDMNATGKRKNSIHMNLMGDEYSKYRSQRVIDIIVFFKYYLDTCEFKIMLDKFKGMLMILNQGLEEKPFVIILESLGILRISDLDKLL